jgi:hypothetical protein
MLLREISKFILQRHFKGKNLPSHDTIIKTYMRTLLRYEMDDELVKSIAANDSRLIAELNEWIGAVAGSISIIDYPSELHFGHYTIRDTVDAVLYHDGQYHLLEFICGDDRHIERVMSYRTLFNSIWLRHNFSVGVNGFTAITLDRIRGVRTTSFDINISENILRKSIEHILSAVDLGNPATEEEQRAAISTLPAVFGPHCWACMACFDE